jgi:hypothetical protein
MAARFSAIIMLLVVLAQIFVSTAEQWKAMPIWQL